ncbi:unnamed protein product [Rhizoctonia solani]|uniref:BTB domain-containing protein n=1 Tax=Rhizoctonia solani TaxID=456999 RepID=A0A8H3HDD1_9AGAM|nr:unnamed protein product [Rhizoctonia solani]
MDISDDTPRTTKRETITTIAPGVTNNRGSLKDTTEGWFSAVHDLTGANIHLQVNSVVIKTHEDRISKFAHLNSLIQAARNANPQSDTLTITLQGDEKLASNFLNTFKLLSSWSIEKPGNFEFQILLSAALISATYDNPTLLTFCVKQLEGFPLSQVQRLDIGRRLDIKSWREGVYQEMISRETVITKDEALALGIDAYWYIANARESHNQDIERGLWIILTVVLGLWVLCLGLVYVYWPRVPECGI